MKKVFPALEDPTFFKAEIKHLVNLCLPIITTYLLGWFPGIAVIIFCGNLSAEDLAAGALSLLYTNVSGYSICIGLLSALDTLISQSVGVGNFRRIGLLTQRAALIVLVVAIPVTILWFFTEDVLVLLGQNAALSAKSGRFVRWMIPGLYPFYLFEVMKRFLQMQEIVRAPIIVTAFETGAVLILLSIFMSFLDWGLDGAALALAISTQWLPVSLGFVLIIWRKYHKNSWTGFSRAALQNWLEFLRLGLPGLLMLCLEWWGFESLAIIAGWVSDETLASHAVAMQAVVVAGTWSVGLSVAGSARVGYWMGNGQPDKASATARFLYCGALALGCTASMIFYLIRRYWVRLFTNDSSTSSDAELTRLVTTGFYAPTLCMIVDGLQMTQQGVIRGIGRQKWGTIVNLVGYYIIGLPLAYLLGVHFEMGMPGLWLGIGVGMICNATGFAIVLSCSDWRKLSDTAQIRARRDNSKPLEMTGKAEEEGEGFGVEEYEPEEGGLGARSSLSSSEDEAGLLPKRGHS